MHIDLNGLVNATQAIKILGVANATFYKAKERGEIPDPVLVWGGRVYYQKDQLSGLKIKLPKGGWKGRKK